MRAGAEALKLAAGTGLTLSGQLMIIDALTMQCARYGSNAIRRARYAVLAEQAPIGRPDALSGCAPISV